MNLLLNKWIKYEQIIIFARINTMGATNGAGTTYPSGAPEFTPCF